jgi:hypothetical protein
VAFMGVPLEKQLGNSWAEVLHPDDLGRAFMAWKNTLIWAQPWGTSAGGIHVGAGKHAHHMAPSLHESSPMNVKRL